MERNYYIVVAVVWNVVFHSKHDTQYTSELRSLMNGKAATVNVYDKFYGRNNRVAYELNRSTLTK